MATFAVAALVVAILFADRLGPPEELKKRFYQIGLGVAVVLLVGALAALIVPTPDHLIGLFDSGGDPEELPSILKERVSIIVGAGLLLLVGALFQSRSFPTLAPGVMFGAIVMAIIAASESSSGYASVYYQITFDAGVERNLVYTAVLIVGTALLIGYGYKEWDRPAVEMADEEIDEA